jgi:hypothetical protein
MTDYWNSTTEMLSGLTPVAAALVTLIISFFPLIVVGAVLGMIMGIFDGIVASFGRGFRF